jgi:hypothetical protein
VDEIARRCPGGLQRDVERRLDSRLPAVGHEDDERAQQSGDEELRRRGEEQPEHERDLAQRDGVRLAPDLHVQHEELAQPEQHASTGHEMRGGEPLGRHRSRSAQPPTRRRAAEP